MPQELPNDICGIPSAFSYKIFNGTHAAEGAYPWMVAIGNIKGSGSNDWFCGGTLITDQYVVTAARCVDPKDSITPEKLVVRLADLNLDDNKDDNNSTENKQVERIIVHPQYYENKLNDIALIKLKSKVVFDKLKKPICLPSSEFKQNLSLVNESAMLSGWGETNYAQGKVLNEVAVEIKDNVVCRTNNANDWPGVKLEDRVICASSPRKDFCTVNSGGPLMVLRMYKDMPRLYLLGVVSHDFDCARQGHPEVFVKASYFVDWIVENLQI